MDPKIKVKLRTQHGTIKLTLREEARASEATQMYVAAMLAGTYSTLSIVEALEEQLAELKR